MHIERLHADEDGVASMELVLALPTILVAIAVIIHMFQFQRVTYEMIASTRTAGWNSARNDVCLAMPPRRAEVFRAFLYPLPPVCTRRDFDREAAGGSFWAGFEKAARWTSGELTTDVRGAEALDYVIARSFGDYEVRNLHVRFGTWLGAEYAVPKATFWTAEDPALKTGFDRVLKASLGKSIELFPGLFPNVR